jgi:molybdopterin converting factor small subunit
VKIKFYGSLGEAIGREVGVDVPAGTSVADLRRLLANRFPDAAESIASPGFRACVADEVVGEDHRLEGGEEVEFLPPLSGG